MEVDRCGWVWVVKLWSTWQAMIVTLQNGLKSPTNHSVPLRYVVQTYNHYGLGPHCPEGNVDQPSVIMWQQMPRGPDQSIWHIGWLDQWHIDIWQSDTWQYHVTWQWHATSTPPPNQKRHVAWSTSTVNPSWTSHLVTRGTLWHVTSPLFSLTSARQGTQYVD